METKKAQVNIIVPSVLILTLAAVILVFGLIMLDELQGNTATRTGSVSNEVITQAELVANASVGDATTCEFQSFAITGCSNGSSSGNLVLAGNYTYGTNYITNLTSIYVDKDWYCNYTYTYGGEACDAANETIVGISKFAEYYDLIVLAIVISVIIGLLLVVFSMRKAQ